MAVCVDTMVLRYTAGPFTGLLLVPSLYAPCSTLNWLIIRAGCPRSARCFSCLRSERALGATPTASATLVGGSGFLIHRRKKARYWRKVSHLVALEYPKTVIRAPLAVVTSGARVAMGQCRLSKSVPVSHTVFTHFTDGTKHWGFVERHGRSSNHARQRRRRSPEKRQEPLSFLSVRLANFLRQETLAAIGGSHL